MNEIKTISLLLLLALAGSAIAQPLVPQGGRWGEPECKGDINWNGSIAFDDINPFARVLRHPWFFKHFFPRLFWRADINNDGQVNQADVDPFVAVLGGAETICR